MPAHVYTVWTESELEREWDWMQVTPQGDDFDTQVEDFMEGCSSHYPMVKRTAFVKDFLKLLACFNDNLKDYTDAERPAVS